MLKDYLKEQIKLIVNADHWDPFQVLGNHIIEKEGRKAVAIRAFLPEAEKAWVIEAKGKEQKAKRELSEKEKTYPMEKIHRHGFFEAIFDDNKDVFPYRIRIKSYDGITSEFHD